MVRYERAEAIIDLDAVVHNLRVMREGIRPSCGTVAVIKADGYGHGAVPIARVLEPLDEIFGFAVATVEEGAALRDAGIQKPIMLLGYAFASQYREAILHDLWLVVFRYETAACIAGEAAALGTQANVQVAVDTGMNRIGYPVNEESADEIFRIAQMPQLKLQGMFTHFYAADEKDKSAAMAQYERFCRMIRLLKERGVTVPYLHCSNSAAMIDMPEISMDLVRAGIAMYGLTPSDQVRRIDLHPAMTLKARVVHVKTVPAGEKISYGGTYTTPQEQRIATIAFGYADGYPRQLSNRADVLIRGKRAPIRGRICMDQFMVDVSEIPDAACGDEVTLIGTDADECITMEELGARSGRFNYELACCISKRVPKVYTQGKHLV